jgi:hypothetical protein
MTHQCLRLRASDADDLTIFASILQDAIVPVSDIAFVPDERRFAMVANRFLWEADAKTGAEPDHQRVNCGVVVEQVAGVKSRGLDLSERGRMLDLLTVTAEDGGLRFVFSGGADIWLTTDSVDARLEDIGEPWPTKWRPAHASQDESGD